jgi:sec-independent protein translocase protein TatB
VFDIGIGEIAIIAVIGLLIFGPERLPRAAADAAKWLKQIRTMASGARQDLADSAGIDLSETVETVKSLAEFHPRRLAANLLNDEPTTPSGAPGTTASSPQGQPAPPSPPRPAFDPDAT